MNAGSKVTSGRARRDEFSAAVRRKLAQKAGNHCSICRCPTDGPDSGEGTLSVGVAAHITAAAEGGPRFDSALTQEVRRSEANAIWLCQCCAREIDVDLERFSTAHLRRLKRDHAAWARARVGRRPGDIPEAVVANVAALAIHEIRQANTEAQRADPSQFAPILEKISTFGDPLRYPPAVRLEFMDLLQGMASRLRESPLERHVDVLDVISDAARAVRGAITQALPFGTELSADEERVLCAAAEVGGELAYDGVLYTQHLSVVEAGAEILFFVLRVARRGRSVEARRHAEQQFNEAIRAAERSRWSEAGQAIAWLCFRRDEAAGLEPDMPQAALRLLRVARPGARH